MEDRDKIDGILWTFQRYYNNPHLFVYFSRQGKDQIEGWTCLWMSGTPSRIWTSSATEVIFFFCLIILAFDLYRSWRRTFYPVFL